jgi:hypothetical protein
VFLAALVFLGEGSSKTLLQKHRENKSDPGPFLASDPPAHHGDHRFFLAGAPCVADTAAGCGTPAAPRQPTFFQPRGGKKKTQKIRANKKFDKNPGGLSITDGKVYA